MSPITERTETTAATHGAERPVETPPVKFHGRHERTTRTPLKSLRGWRLRHSLDQREAARIIGVSQSTYARLENQTRFPRPQLAKRMKVITGLSIEIIMGIDS